MTTSIPLQVSRRRRVTPPPRDQSPYVRRDFGPLYNFSQLWTFLDSFRPVSSAGLALQGLLDHVGLSLGPRWRCPGLYRDGPRVWIAGLRADVQNRQAAYARVSSGVPSLRSRSAIGGSGRGIGTSPKGSRAVWRPESESDRAGRG